MAINKSVALLALSPKCKSNCQTFATGAARRMGDGESSVRVGCFSLVLLQDHTFSWGHSASNNFNCNPVSFCCGFRQNQVEIADRKGKAVDGKI